MAVQFPKPARATLLILLVMSGYEVIRQLLLPSLSTWESHLATVLFCTAFGGLLSTVIHRRMERSRVELLKEIESRRQVEEQLRLQATALDAAANAIVITDRSGAIAWVNPAFSKLTGYSAAEVVGGNPRVLKSGKHDSQFYAGLWGTIASGQVWQGEVTNRRKDGSEYVEEMTITPVRSAAGDVTHFIAIKVDVTGRRRAEEAISRSEATLSALVKDAPIGIYRVTPGGRFLSANPAVCRMLGYDSEEDLLSLDIATQIYCNPEDRAAAVQKLLQAGELRNFETTWKRKDGAEIHVRIGAHVRHDRTGETAFEGFVEDITGRKRAEAALQDREKYFRSLIENALDVIVVAGTDGTLHFASPSIETNFGYKPESLTGKNVFQYVHPEDHLKAGVALSKVLLAPGTVERLECRMSHQDGRWKVVEALGACVPDGKGGQVIVLNARDITERKLVEDELRKSEHNYRTLFTEARKLQEQLLQSQKLEALGKLAGGIAHDFNNILMIVKSYSDMVLDKVDGESPLRRPIEQIRAAGDRATALVRQLLAFSRRELIVPKVLNLDQVLADLKKMLPRLLGEDVKLEVAATDDLWSIVADPSQIEQIIFNLAVNARDAMPEGGRLMIASGNVELDDKFVNAHPEARAGKFVVLVVSDTGTGISPEIQERMFEPFFTTKEAGKGTGLGLSTVYGIVKQSHGFITVDSEPGKGAAFHIYLPHTAEPVAPQEAQRIRTAPDLRTNILVVEDEGPTREAISEYLGVNGFQVFAAPSPLEALRACQENNHRVDILLTDVVMPGMRGTELAERIREHHPKVKVIFMSGYTDDMLFRSGTRPDQVNFLLKPFGLPELVAKVNHLLKLTGDVDA
ncbi:MAG: PAS domain S-box protein [Terriglobales bacterium]|jgi:PAS domain S-box-containing protein